MQAAQSTFLALLLAHLLGDFFPQPKWLLQNKGERPWPLICHGLAHYVLAWVCLVLFAPATFLSVPNHAVIGGYACVHLLIDKLKYMSIAHEVLPDNWPTFLLHRSLHLVVLAIAACAVVSCSPAALFAGFSLPPSARNRILQAAIIYVAVIFGGGYLIRYLTRNLAAKSTAENPPRLENAGLYVGWIERFLVLTAIVLQSPVLAGLILTSKSIARFPEFKQARFAEYFLIGTLLSLALSIAGGVLLLYLFHGEVSLK